MRRGGVCARVQQGGSKHRRTPVPPTNAGKKKPPHEMLDPIQLQFTERGPRKERVLAIKGSQVCSARHYLDCRDCIASANFNFFPPTHPGVSHAAPGDRVGKEPN